MLQRVRIALLGVWLGLMALFSFVVAPAAFAALPSHLAGELVSRVLSSVEIAGILIGVILLICLASEALKQRRVAALGEGILLALMTLSALVSRFVVSARLHAIRLLTGESIASLPSGDPVRSTFDTLHQTSVGLMGFNLLAAIVLLAILVSRVRRRGSAIPPSN